MCFQVPEGGVKGAGRRASSSRPPPVCLPPGQPLLWTLFPCTGGHTKEHQRTEPEGAGAGDGVYRRCRLFSASRANPKKMEEERQTEKDGLGEEEGGGREKDPRERARAGVQALWYLAHQLLPFTVGSPRPADRRGLFVCLYVCSFLRGTQIGVGCVARAQGSQA